MTRVNCVSENRLGEGDSPIFLTGHRRIGTVPDGFRRRLLIAAVASLAAVGVVPWRLVARAAEQTESAASSATAPGEPTVIPGKIYLRTKLKGPMELRKPSEYVGFIVVDPNTGAWERLGDLGKSMRVSPDGRLLAFTRDNEVWDAPTSGDGPKRLAKGDQPIWGPDSHHLLYRAADENSESSESRWYCMMPLAGVEGKPKRPAIPPTDSVYDWSLEGDWLACGSDDERFGGPRAQWDLYRIHPDGTDRKLIGRNIHYSGGGSSARFSPDGKQIAYIGSPRPLAEANVWVTDLEGENGTQIMAGGPGSKHVPTDLCWSPDGKWLAVRTMSLVEGEVNGKKAPVPGDNRIELFAADGTPHGELKLKNVDTVVSLEDPNWR